MGGIFRKGGGIVCTDLTSERVCLPPHPLVVLSVQSGDTVLIGAVRGGHVEIVRALLQKYADIDIRGQVRAAGWLAPSLKAVRVDWSQCHLPAVALACLLPLSSLRH